MFIDPNRYRGTLDAMRSRILDTAFDTPSVICSRLSVGSHVPLIAVLLYAARTDNYGPIPELVELIASTKAFYGYTKIVPWSDVTQLT